MRDEEHMTETMRAMEVTSNGVKMIEIPKPKPGQGEIRVKVVTSVINTATERVIGGGFVGRFIHAKTSPLVVGWDFAGTVDTLGDGITGLDQGAAVWGHLTYSSSQKQGTFSDYITIPYRDIAIKPANISYHLAAAAATDAMTSLQSLRDLGRLSDGDKVLIIGASGGVGSVAVGIGKRLGGHVTGVYSTKDVAHVKTLGADAVIDRKNSDPLDVKSVYDIIFDTPSVHSYGRSAKALRPGGAYITTLPNTALITGMARALFTSKRCHFVQVASKQADLELVGGWLNDGLNVPIDSHFKIAELGAALKRQTDHGRIGRVVIDVAEGWPS
jgi:NADPH:quinone reductase-like Zn-dependent oxidoreductase